MKKNNPGLLAGVIANSFKKLLNFYFSACFFQFCN
jgi:hypothetical protein